MEASGDGEVDLAVKCPLLATCSRSEKVDLCGGTAIGGGSRDSNGSSVVGCGPLVFDQSSKDEGSGESIGGRSGCMLGYSYIGGRSIGGDSLCTFR